MLTQDQTAILLKLDAELTAGRKPRAPKRGTPDAVALYSLHMIDIEADGAIVITARGKKEVRLAMLAGGVDPALLVRGDLTKQVVAAVRSITASGAEATSVVVSHMTGIGADTTCSMLSALVNRGALVRGGRRRRAVYLVASGEREVAA